MGEQGIPPPRDAAGQGGTRDGRGGVFPRGLHRPLNLLLPAGRGRCVRARSGSPSVRQGRARRGAVRRGSAASLC